MRKYILIITLSFTFHFICFSQEAKKVGYFFRFSNFKPDFGFSSNQVLDIKDNLMIYDADPTNNPGHSYEIGISKFVKKASLHINNSFGILNARQLKQFINYRSYEDQLEFGMPSFYILGQAYEHTRIFFNTSIEKNIFYGFFIEPGIKITVDVSSKKNNIGFTFNTFQMQETYASTFYDIPRQSTDIFLFYNIRFGYTYKGFAITLFYEKNFTNMQRSFTLRGNEYIEKQPYWKNIGLSLSYKLELNKIKKDR